MKSVYPSNTPFDAKVSLPHYDIKADGGVYRTLAHPKGWSGLPEYEIRSDMKFYRTTYHSGGLSALPEYEIRNSNQVYRLSGHPDGENVFEPDFEIR